MRHSLKAIYLKLIQRSVTFNAKGQPQLLLILTALSHLQRFASPAGWGTAMAEQACSQQVLRAHLHRSSVHPYMSRRWQALSLQWQPLGAEQLHRQREEAPGWLIEHGKEQLHLQ